MPRRYLANHILGQVENVGHAKELFLMDLTKVAFSSLPSFYQCLLNTWQAFTGHCDLTTYDRSMFLNEPLFHNTLFEGFDNNRTVIRKFANASITKVCQLINNGKDKWQSVAAIASDWH